MDFDDSFEAILKSLVKNESLVTVELAGRDTGIEGRIVHIGNDYIKVKPEMIAAGRVYFIQIGTISYIDTVEPTESDLNVPLPDKEEDDPFRRRLKPL